MAAKQIGRRGWIAVGAAALLLGGVGLWRERTGLLAWVQVRGLARAGDADRTRWVERVANLGETALPPLARLFQRTDDQPCRNARAALERLTTGWGLDDPRTVGLVRRLTRAFDRLSTAGRENALLLTLGWLGPDSRGKLPEPLRAALVPLLAACAEREDEVRLPALDLCAALLARTGSEDVLAPARALVRGALQADSPAVRVRAVKLTVVEGLDLVELAVPLLADPAAEVRRAAVLAVGPADHLVQDESLLPCLHDPDPEVRRLCELALQGRGLRPEHLHLGRLLTDPHPSVRLEVLDHLQQARDLDPDLWLRRLSHDPSPAVRAGAVRMMSQLAQLEQADLGDRIDQMSRSDPSPTVCELARYYRKGRRPTSGPGDP